jgi:hypothetical protein
MLVEPVEDEEHAQELAQKLHEHYCEHGRQRLNEGVCA